MEDGVLRLVTGLPRLAADHVLPEVLDAIDRRRSSRAEVGGLGLAVLVEVVGGVVDSIRTGLGLLHLLVLVRVPRLELSSRLLLVVIRARREHEVGGDGRDEHRCRESCPPDLSGAQVLVGGGALVEGAGRNQLVSPDGERHQDDRCDDSHVVSPCCWWLLPVGGLGEPGSRDADAAALTLRLDDARGPHGDGVAGFEVTHFGRLGILGRRGELGRGGRRLEAIDHLGHVLSELQLAQTLTDECLRLQCAVSDAEGAEDLDDHGEVTVVLDDGHQRLQDRSRVVHLGVVGEGDLRLLLGQLAAAVDEVDDRLGVGIVEFAHQSEQVCGHVVSPLPCRDRVVQTEVWLFDPQG